MVFTDQNNNVHDILYLYDYHSYWYIYRSVKNRYFDENSNLILNLKNGKSEAIERFFHTINPMINAGVCIAVVPSHDPARLDSGIRKLGAKLATDGRINAIDCLIRTKEIAKLASGGDRREQTHIDSIVVQDGRIIQGRKVCLLDDVMTTGNSVRACMRLLQNSGAKTVKCLVLGKTVKRNY